MVAALAGARSACATLAGETFWSRSQFQLGRKVVEFRWVPSAEPDARARGRSDHELTYDLVDRLRDQGLGWHLEVRGWVNARETPLDDGRKPWSGAWVRVGTLEIPRQPRLSAEQAQRAIRQSERLGFSIANRWTNDDACLRGRGLLNEVRAEVYAASQAGRGSGEAVGRACPHLGRPA
jgi:hypothetical protein